MKIYKSNNFRLKLVKEPNINPVKKVKITKSQNIEIYLREIWQDIDIYESAYIIGLNNANNTLGFMQLSKGGITGTVMDIRLIAKFLIETLSTCAIIAHNHPSGTLTPSYSDTQITKKIKDGLNLLDIKLLDHIILTNNGYHSFADNGTI